LSYSTLLLDLDHTLLDSDASEAAAFAQTMAGFGIDDPQARFPIYDRINRSLWEEVELGTVAPTRVRFIRFERFIAEIEADADPEHMADAFAQALGASGDLYPGARQVLEAVAGRASLGMVTNGLSDIQRARIERLDIERYFDAIVISGEVGTSKPDVGIFDIAFERLANPDPATALMVGDSLSSDMAGAWNYGIATCWYNARRAPAPTDRLPDHEIVELEELPAIVVGGPPDRHD